MDEQTEMAMQDPVVEVLLEENILDEAGVRKLLLAHSESGQSLLSLLRNQNIVTQEQLIRLTAISNDIDFINLCSDMIDPVAVRLISFEFARQYNLIPVRIEKDRLYVAMSSPLNLAARDMITTRTGYRVVPLAAAAEAIKHAISYHFNVESVTRQDIVQMRLKDSADAGSKGKRTRVQSENVTNAPIVRLVDSIITGAVDSRASDIHIQPQEPDMKVRYRIDGILVDALEVPASAHREVISHVKILAGMDISERRIPQDGHINFNHNGKDYDLRVSSLPVTGGEKIVMRILDTTTGLARLDDIVSSSDDAGHFRQLISNPCGMILLTGPTGSGKTTTLYSMIQTLNTPDQNIVTVEDPVEYRLDGITQVQVNAKTGMTFASSLRSILRQDPDIILVGEIRDLETAEIAISAALTGHLVLSTLHTNDAAGAVSRLVHLGVKPFQVASAIIGIVAQRLVRTICSNCSETYQASQEESAFLTSEDAATPAQGLVFHKGAGCEICRNSGYRGRRAVYEILDISPDMRKMIVDGASSDQIKSYATGCGMKTLKKQGIDMVLKGLTAFEELQRVIDMREE